MSASLGRVLGNRSVLYKYLNPNMVAIATIRSTDTTTNTYLYLIDTVTGSIFHRSSYLGAGHVSASKTSVHLIQVDNSVVLSFYNHGPSASEMLMEPQNMENEISVNPNRKRKQTAVKNTTPEVKGYEVVVMEVYENLKPDQRMEG